MAAHSSPVPCSHSPIYALKRSPTSNNSNINLNSNKSTPRLTIEGLLNLLQDKVEFVPFSVDHDNFKESSLQLLNLVFPNWFTNGSKDLKLSQCTDGITNKLMKCKNLNTGQVVLIRAYGKNSELFIDRQAELITFVALQDDGLAPPLHCRFENGFVYGYVQGIPLKHSQLSLPTYFPLIARKLARWHQADSVPGDHSPRLFKTIRKWFKNVPKSYNRPDLDDKFSKCIDMKYLESELERLEIIVKSLNCPVVFCHNDLLSSNIIYNPDAKDVSFIDYEYGSFNYRSFDIANHFCEFAGFECDYFLFPSELTQRQWIKEYLSTLENCTDEQVEQVLREVAVFTLISHLFWLLWALVQAQVSDIHFDYMSYAINRFIEFKRLNKQC